EALLGEDPPQSHPLVIPSRGSKLVGGSIRTELTRAELDAVLLDGFFPVVSADARPAVPRRVGLTTIGLPYASDAAMTRHLAAFLARASSASSGEGEGEDGGGRSFVHPSAVL